MAEQNGATSRKVALISGITGQVKVKSHMVDGNERLTLTLSESLTH